jgi:hypothetical protein
VSLVSFLHGKPTFRLSTIAQSFEPPFRVSRVRTQGSTWDDVELKQLEHGRFDLCLTLDAQYVA